MRLILLSLLFISWGAHAQVPDSLAGLQRLNKQDGFWHLRFGTPIERIKGLEQVGQRSYIRPQEQRKIGPHAVSSVRYDFVANRLFVLVIQVADSSAYPQVLRLLQARYGLGHLDSAGTRYIWVSNCIRMHYHFTRGKLLIINTKLQNDPASR